MPIEEPGFTPDYAAVQGNIPYKAPTSHLQAPDFGRQPRQLSPTERAALNKTGAESSGIIPYDRRYNMSRRQEGYEDDRSAAREFAENEVLSAFSDIVEKNKIYKTVIDKNGNKKRVLDDINYKQIYKDVEDNPQLKRNLSIIANSTAIENYNIGKIESLSEKEARFFDWRKNPKYAENFWYNPDVMKDFALNYPKDPKERMKWIYKNLVKPEYLKAKDDLKTWQAKVDKYESMDNLEAGDRISLRSAKKMVEQIKMDLRRLENNLKYYGAL